MAPGLPHAAKSIVLVQGEPNSRSRHRNRGRSMTLPYRRGYLTCQPGLPTPPPPRRRNTFAGGARRSIAARSSGRAALRARRPDPSSPRRASWQFSVSLCCLYSHCCCLFVAGRPLEFSGPCCAVRRSSSMGVARVLPYSNCLRSRTLIAKWRVNYC